jgi:hypothetical protein
MPLGVGVSTPFSQPCNYHTALNHCFRDESSYKVSAQARMKCPYCGVWGLRGMNCKLCHTVIPGNAALFLNRENAGNKSGRRTPNGSSRSNTPGGSSRSASTTPGKTASAVGHKTPTRTLLRQMDQNVSYSATSPKVGSNVTPRNQAGGYQPQQQQPDQGVRSSSAAAKNLVFPQRAEERRQQLMNNNGPNAFEACYGESLRECGVPVESMIRSASATSSLSQLSEGRSQTSGAVQSMESTGKPQEKVAPKIKCNYCGIWMQPGRICALCRTAN